LAEENKVLRRRNQKTGDELLLSNTLKDVDEFFEKERQFLVEYHSNLKDCTIKADRYSILKAVVTLAKVSAIMPMTVTCDSHHPLATLGDAMQVEMILSLLRRPRWTKQVLLRVIVADSFANKLRQCKRSIKTFLCRRRGQIFDTCLTLEERIYKNVEWYWTPILELKIRHLWQLKHLHVLLLV